MNIFASSQCPVASAMYLDNKRLVKMVLETAQLLSTAIHESDAPEDLKCSVYKKTHVNHPCSIWVRQSKDNYTWLLNHFTALCSEYTKRYGRIHKSQDLFVSFLDGSAYIKDATPMGFIFCGDSDIQEESVFDSYKVYLNRKWKSDGEKRL